MSAKQFFLLLFISSLWGGSFIFMKILSPIFGPILTSSFRLIAASLFLFVLYYFQKYKVHWKRDWKLFIIIGLGNSAVPFVLYAYAALYIPASLSVILNSTSPMFGAIFGFLLLGDRLSYNKYIGLVLGSLGVGIVSSLTLANGTLELYLSIAGCVGAALLYGLTGAYVKKYALHIEPKQLTLGTLTFAGLMLLPLGIIFPVTTSFGMSEIGLLIIFGVMCTSVPYIIYYKLLQEIGPIKALTVTYLMPVFGVLWSFLYLEEPIELNMIIGLLVILIGIYILSLRLNKENIEKTQ